MHNLSDKELAKALIEDYPDTMVDKLFRREGETVEEAKERLRK